MKRTVSKTMRKFKRYAQTYISEEDKVLADFLNLMEQLLIFIEPIDSIDNQEFPKPPKTFGEAITMMAMWAEDPASSLDNLVRQEVNFKDHNPRAWK